MPAILYFVVPCYNDEQTLPASVPVFLEKLETLIGTGKISDKSRLLLINDGSADRTWECIVRFQQENPDRITGLDLAGNYGEQNALIAGMTFAEERADCVITMDSDLQDDINAVDEMLEHFNAGKDVVLGVRNDRSSDSAMEKLSSKCFYLLMKAAKTGLVEEHSNYRLLSKRAVGMLLEELPANYFLPCVASDLRLPRATVFYSRQKRIAGDTGYKLSGKLRLAKDAVFSHSAFPLKIISLLCGLHLLAAVVFLLLLLFCRWEGAFACFFALTVACFSCAVILLALRIVGEYVRKVLIEVRDPLKFRIGSVAEKT